MLIKFFYKNRHNCMQVTAIIELEIMQYILVWEGPMNNIESILLKTSWVVCILVVQTVSLSNFLLLMNKNVIKDLC